MSRQSHEAWHGIEDEIISVNHIDSEKNQINANIGKTLVSKVIKVDDHSELDSSKIMIV